MYAFGFEYAVNKIAQRWREPSVFFDDSQHSFEHYLAVQIYNQETFKVKLYLLN